MDVDVLIVGAGPAGSTTARFCASKDIDVLMIDRRREIGYPVQCGELLPDTDEMYTIFPEGQDLKELFTLPSHLIQRTCDNIDLISPGGKTYRCEFKSHVLDRRFFDKHLVDLAINAGSRLSTDSSLLSLENGIARTTLGDIKAKVIVGADGPNSRTMRQAGMDDSRMNYPAVTCQAKGSFEPVVKMYFGSVAPGGYGWIIPKASGANIGVGFNPNIFKGRPRTVFDKFMATMDCEYGDVTMGLVPMSGPASSTVRENVLLVGDAAGHVMATNGGGIPTAMIAGRIAGKTIAEHLAGECSLSVYEKRWREVMGKPLRTALSTRRLANIFFPNDRLLGMSMRILGRRGLNRAIRCKRILL
ncbi:MAG: NAD(P)/FAD-dependent oxidoreductase [Thermoplasmata archaeon]|nr:NAD(P)/FAD-dependent oxidoreductase [Thermoplasmata archaeon]TFG70757.1 MAG: NAD(P)/FAD-dependent oxidoreductase [Methanomassiliicoccus sp.]